VVTVPDSCGEHAWWMWWQCMINVVTPTDPRCDSAWLLRRQCMIAVWTVHGKCVESAWKLWWQCMIIWWPCMTNVVRAWLITGVTVHDYCGDSALLLWWQWIKVKKAVKFILKQIYSSSFGQWCQSRYKVETDDCKAEGILCRLDR